jgi:hypothetical protein
MTSDNGKRMLPPLPHPDYLRKEAKTRLIALKARVPGARLADVQFTLAREYGVENWGALLAEVARRSSGPRGARARVKRAHVAALYPERFRQDGLLDQEEDIETHAAFFRAGVIVQIGFVLAALVGVSLLFINPAQLHALMVRLVHSSF